MPNPNLKEGDTVGHYVVDGLIGEGGMGKVYRAKDPRLERTVALKVIAIPHPDDADVSEFSARLLREARAVASLNHGNVVGVFDVGETQDVLYLAMEHVTGDTLRALIQREDPKDGSWARRVRWLVEVARGLAAAHKAGLVHRDVKPENVIVREDGAVKVLDFGIARRTIVGPGDKPIDTITGRGIAGTPVYMAPEQIRGEKVDARADQFSWGVLAYELLCGERPFVPKGGDMLPVLAAILSDAPTPLSERVPDLPAAVAQTIGRTLTKDPAKRFASMDDVADALEPFAATNSADRRVAGASSSRLEGTDAFAATTRVPTTVSSPPLTVLEPIPAKRSRRAFRVALVAALLGTLAGVFYYRAHRRNAVLAQPRPVSTVPEAAMAYRDAMQLWHDGAQAKATRKLEDAVRIDPTLAAAHIELAMQKFQTDPADAEDHLAQAFQHRAYLDDRNAAFLDAVEPYVRPSPDLEEWETRMMRAVYRFPRDAAFQFWLGRARERQREYATAKTAFEASTRIDPAFIPGIWGMGGALRSTGDDTGAIAAYEACLQKSPVAVICLESRARLLADKGQCARAKDDATAWSAIDTQSPLAEYTLAQSLFAVGAPRPSVDEVLRERVQLLPAADQKNVEVKDKVDLAVLDGRFEDAIAGTRELETLLPHTATRGDHAEPALRRALLLYETGDVAGAAAVAREYLDTMDAWQPAPLAMDPSIDFQEYLYRAGKIDKATFAKERGRWLDAERAKEAQSNRRGPKQVATLWVKAYASFAETPDEAREALAALREVPELTPAAESSLLENFAIGKVYALAGIWDEALDRLSRVTSSCVALAQPQPHTRAHYFLGLAYEAKGDTADAKRTYDALLARWGNAPSSRTAADARKRRAALH